MLRTLYTMSLLFFGRNASEYKSTHLKRFTNAKNVTVQDIQILLAM